MGFPRPLLSLAAVCVAVLVLFAGAAHARGQKSLLIVNANDAHVGLGMLAPPGSAVTFSEVVGGRRVALGTAKAGKPKNGYGIASIHPVPWVCDRQVRSFVAVAVTREGKRVTATNRVRTPDCRDRVAVVAPARVKPGVRVPIRLEDRWHLGDLRMHVCVARPDGERKCWWFELAPGQSAITVRRRVGAAVGALDIGLQVAGFRQHVKTGVGQAVAADPQRPVALVTGDSMVEGIDTLLSDRLRKLYRVVGQSRPGTGVSSPVGVRWPTFAQDEASRIKPALTVVLLGVNDGYPLKSASGDEVPCCGAAWQVQYLARLAAMAFAYMQKGHGTLVWALLPPPRRPDLVAQITAVNAAVRLLAAGMPQIRLVPLDKVFGPEYRDAINGQQVRDADGLHLSLAGQRLAARAIVKVIHAEPSTPPPPA